MPEAKPVRFAVLAVVASMAAGLLWLGVVRYQAEQRTVAAAGREAVPAGAGAPAAAAAPVAAESASLPPVPKPVVQLVVHVAGAVAKPGVYRLEEGARVADAVLAAGGALPEGVPDALNLADKLSDGQKVYVQTTQELQSPTPPPAAAGASHGPAVAAAPNPAVATKPVGKVNVNNASVTQLDQLPGITPTAAKNIVDYRTKNGPFKRLEDLDKVSGIGPSTLEKIKPHITL